jgi:predicted nucleic acid-binding protein
LLNHDVVTGQRIFDVFLVATMMDNQVRTLYTQNTKDFSRFTDIQAINPFEPSFSARK